MRLTYTFSSHPAAEDLFNIDEFQIEGLAAENKRLHEEIARLEKERESEPVSKLPVLAYVGGLNFQLLNLLSLFYRKSLVIHYKNGNLFLMLYKIPIRLGYYGFYTMLVAQNLVSLPKMLV